MLAVLAFNYVTLVNTQEDLSEVSTYVDTQMTLREKLTYDRWLFRNRNNNHHGPSCRATCRIINEGSCGTGTIVGITKDGYSLILTNAHVAGSRLGHVVKVQVESTGAKLKGRVIMAAYSDKYLADWAILKTTIKYAKVKPVKLNTQRPTGSHYTKGFPRCQPMAAGDVNMVVMSKNSPLAKWTPNSIGGQSGSGVFNDKSGHIECLLTWSWSGFGAGQMTSEIYKQALGGTEKGALRMDGLIEIDGSCCGGGIVPESGFFSECDITDLDIWANVPE